VLKLFHFGKYKTIILSIGIFVLLVAGTMAMNFFISSRLADDAVVINLSGRQRMLSQRLIKNLLDLQNTAGDGGNIDYPLSDLAKTVTLFDTTLRALQAGGIIMGSDGQPVKLDKAEVVTEQLLLAEAWKLWSPYKQLLDEIIKDKPHADWFINLAKVIDYGQRNNLAMLDLLQTLATDSQTPAEVHSIALMQGMLSQRMVKELFTLKASIITGRHMTDHLKTLQHTATLFDTSLTAFQTGATVHDPQGHAVVLTPPASPASQQALNTAIRIWAPYKSLLNDIFDNVPDTAWVQQLAGSVTYSREHNLTLLKLMNELTTEIEQRTRAKVKELQHIQAVAITLALLYFFFVLCRFVRQLRQSDAIAEQAHQETEDILNTVQEGLFLLNQDLRLGSQYSRETCTFFATDALEGKTLYDLLDGMVTAKDMQLTKDYVNLLLAGRVNEKLVRDINPLNQVEVSVDRGEGHFDVKYLSFHFNRVIVDKKLSHLLVTMHDVSERVKLQKELAEAQEKSQDQLDMLMNILHVDRPTLERFLHDTLESLHSINEIFRHNQISPSNARHQIDAIFRIMHKIKGEAATLGLASFETRAHAFEDGLMALRAQETIAGNDFLPLTVKLDELLHHQAAVQVMVQRFMALPMPEPLSAASDEPESRIWESMHALVQRMATTQGKRVTLHTDGLDATVIPEQYQKPLQDIVIQLLRNSVTHGIEPPEERLACHKNDTGEVEVRFELQETGYTLVVRDDGRGIDAEQLRARVLAQGRWDAEEVTSWEQERLMSLIYEPGFSTATDTTQDAGRGVGMDLVKETVEEMEGHLEMSTMPGQYCEFRIVLPRVAALSSAL
jgi:chemotaxis protein histidine kinase CheA